VGEAVRVHRRFGDRPRIGARRRDEDVGLFEERRRPGALDEFGGEFAERQVLAPRLDEAEGRDVPERRGPAISQYDLVALRQPEEVGQTGAEMFHDPSDARLTVARPRYLGASVLSASTDSLRIFDGPDPKRPSAGSKRSDHKFGQGNLQRVCGSLDPGTCPDCRGTTRGT